MKVCVYANRFDVVVGRGRLDALVVFILVAVHHLGVTQQLLEVFGGVETVGALVDPHFLLVDIAEVVEVVPGVLREEVATAARVVSFNLALREVFFVKVVEKERVAAAHYQRVS